MNVYQNEYGDTIFSDNGTVVPLPGDTVTIDTDEYTVVGRNFVVVDNYVIITISQSSQRTKPMQTESADIGRQNQMHNAIIKVSNRQDVMEKKSRALADQVSALRKNVIKQSQQDKKVL